MQDKHKLKRLLITGISGLLGNNLGLFFKQKYEILGLCHAHDVHIDGIQIQSCDLISKEAAQKIIETFQPRIIIHCAALSKPDQCEDNQDLAYQSNVVATQNIIESIDSAKTKYVHISTDAVFDGTKGNYNETDEPNPPHFYGKTKWEGEQASLKIANALIARINIFGWNIQDKQSLAEWMVGELFQKREINGFTDAIFSSIYTFELAKMLEQALDRDLAGVYHFGSRTSMSKYQFAVELAKIFNLDENLIKPSSVDQFEFKAARARDLSLDVSKLTRDLGEELPTLQESIEAFHRDFSDGLPKRIKQNVVSNVKGSTQ